MMDLEAIPPGCYCYSKMEHYVDSAGKHMLRLLDVCPYWGIDNSKPEQMNGYCKYLDVRDWEEGSQSLLWDKVKECDINAEDK